MYRTVLLSRKIAILPKEYVLYNYHLGVKNQQVSLKQMDKYLNDCEKTLNIISTIPVAASLSQTRKKTLCTIAKGMFYLIMVIISKNKPLYNWQKKIRLRNAYSNIKYMSKHGLPKITKGISINLLNNGSVRLSSNLVRIGFSILPSGFVSAIRKTEKLRPKSEK
jgi:hypothetical protein